MHYFFLFFGPGHRLGLYSLIIGNQETSMKKSCVDIRIEIDLRWPWVTRGRESWWPMVYGLHLGVAHMHGVYALYTVQHRDKIVPSWSIWPTRSDVLFWWKRRFFCIFNNHILTALRWCIGKKWKPQPNYLCPQSEHMNILASRLQYACKPLLLNKCDTETGSK